jgi:nicotinate-nucleotide adenylyltransferase
MPRMIGVYGGTFDPVHYGHLRTALEAFETLGLDEMRLTPCRVPAHRDAPGASAEDRLAMLAAALRGAEPGFVVDPRELQREGPSYMIDTLASLRAELGDAPLCLIVGQDAFHGLPGWRRWRELFDFAHLAVMRRPDAAMNLAEELARTMALRRAETAEALRDGPAGRILCLEVTQLAISASAIRRTIRDGRSPRYLAPDPVLALIRERGLYGSGSAATVPAAR